MVVILWHVPAQAIQTVQTLEVDGEKYSVLIRNSTIPSRPSSRLISHKKFQKSAIDYDSDGTLDLQEVRTKDVRVRHSLPLRNQYFRIEYWIDQKDGTHHYVYNLVEHEKRYLLTQHEFNPWRIWYNSGGGDTCENGEPLNKLKAKVTHLKDDFVHLALRDSNLFDQSCRYRSDFNQIVTGVYLALMQMEDCIDKGWTPEATDSNTLLPLFQISEGSPLKKITCQVAKTSSMDDKYGTMNLRHYDSNLTENPEDLEVTKFYAKEAIHELFHPNLNLESKVLAAADCCSGGSTGSCKEYSQKQLEEAQIFAILAFLAQIQDSAKLAAALDKFPKEVQRAYLEKWAEAVNSARDHLETCLAKGNSNCDESATKEIRWTQENYMEKLPQCLSQEYKDACGELQTATQNVLAQLNSCPADLKAPLSKPQDGKFAKVLDLLTDLFRSWKLGDFLLPSSRAAVPKETDSCLLMRLEDFNHLIPPTFRQDSKSDMIPLSPVIAPIADNDLAQTKEDRRRSETAEPIPSSPSPNAPPDEGVPLELPDGPALKVALNPHIPKEVIEDIASETGRSEGERANTHEDAHREVTPDSPGEDSRSSGPWSNTREVDRSSSIARNETRSSDSILELFSPQFQSIAQGIRSLESPDRRSSRSRSATPTKHVVAVNFGTSIAEMKEIIRDTFDRGSILDDFEVLLRTLKPRETLGPSENKAPERSIEQLLNKFNMRPWSPNLVKVGNGGNPQDKTAQDGSKIGSKTSSGTTKGPFAKRNPSGQTSAQNPTKNLSISQKGTLGQGKRRTFRSTQDLIDYLTSDYDTVRVELKRRWLSIELNRHHVLVVDHKGQELGPQKFRHKLIYSREIGRLVVQ